MTVKLRYIRWPHLFIIITDKVLKWGLQGMLKIYFILCAWDGHTAIARLALYVSVFTDTTKCTWILILLSRFFRSIIYLIRVITWYNKVGHILITVYKSKKFILNSSWKNCLLNNFSKAQGYYKTFDQRETFSKNFNFVFFPCIEWSSFLVPSTVYLTQAILSIKQIVPEVLSQTSVWDTEIIFRRLGAAELIRPTQATVLFSKVAGLFRLMYTVSLKNILAPTGKTSFPTLVIISQKVLFQKHCSSSRVA